ncbi:hypothetical protein BN1708_008643 [Verticillium longisporum]|uniref:Uncharacterized protein n=1 Tax=Verticillium longisporum TaxID=100787 RepID=A0A0G4N6H6_VERLO|nr:hypothetical protein BN1708_008643 [Verticillium longisporum]
MTPEKTLRYSIGMNVKLKAVTAGHSLHELTMLVGTVRRIRSTTCSRLSPARNACIPKKDPMRDA